MSAGGELKTLFTIENLQHKICGMHINLARQVRQCSQDQAQGISQNFRSAVRTIDPTLTVAVLIGGPIKANFLELDGKQLGQQDVIIFLLSDVTDIDSKEITFIKGKLDSRIIDKLYKTLYKLDASVKIGN